MSRTYVRRGRAVRGNNTVTPWWRDTYPYFYSDRNACGVARKTSVRYSGSLTRSSAWARARSLARRLAQCPARRLREFRFGANS